MTPAQSGALMKRARHLLRAGKLTPYDLTLLDCLVWSCRAPGLRSTVASLTRLARLARMAKNTVVSGVHRLERLGLLRRHHQRVRVRWGLGVASRQATNRYEFLPPATESAPRPVYRGQGTLLSPVPTTVEQALRKLQQVFAVSPPSTPPRAAA